MKTCDKTDRDPRPSPWFFRVGSNDAQAARLFRKFINHIKRSRAVRVRKVAILYEDRDIFGEQGAAVTKREFAKHRGTTVHMFPYPTILRLKESLSNSACTVDEAKLVKMLKIRARQIERYRPDVVFALSYTPDAITAVQTMQHIGYMPPALLAYGTAFTNSAFIDGVRAGNYACGLGSADPTGIVARTSWPPDSKSQAQQTQRIAQLYYAHSGHSTPQAAVGFTAMMIFAQAINNAGSTDAEKVRRALHKLEVPDHGTIMPWNGVKFDDRGDNERAQYLLQQIIEGRYTVVYPPNVASTTPSWPLATARRR